ncbi:MAG: tetratricopeptide repeat protein [Gammaproteobacteria bacterium]|nr:tetratricopeptide repeat protein [Gammaproteobacteria bacterium]
MSITLLSSVHAATPLDEARQLGQQGNWQESLAQTSSYLKKNPGDVDALFLKGIAASKSGNPSQAIASFEEITRRRPDLPEPYNNLAVLYAKAGEYEKAQQALEHALATHPSYATAHNNLSQIYKKLAAIAYDRALNLKAGASQNEAPLALIDSLHPVATAPIKAGVEKVAIAPPAPTPSAASGQPPAATSLRIEDKAKKADIKDIAQTVQGWARAWSTKDVSGYLGHYSPDYFPSDVASSRADWEQQRQERLTRPKLIKVQVDRLQVEMIDEQTASAVFRQHYRSDRISDTVRKQLRLKQQDNHWLIIEETILR